MYENALDVLLVLSGKAVNVPNDGKTGTSRNDLFHSRPGAVMAGSDGDDTYYLWSATASILETSGQGIDTAYIKYYGAATLAEGVENLVLDSAGAIAGTGNGLDNIIIAGTAGAELNGAGGNDVLVGGTGGDIFRIQAGSGSDKIYGFEESHDVIKLDGYGITGFDQLLSKGVQDGSDVRFAFDNGEQLVLADTLLNGLSNWDFGFAMPQAALPVADGITIFREPGRAQNHHGWYVLNNTYGVGNMKMGVDYTSEARFDNRDMTAGTTFSWAMPYTTKSNTPILAYPEVIFGVPPLGANAKNPTDTAAVFPVRVGDLVSLVADQDVSFSGNVGGFNVAYDIWFTSVPNGDRSTVTNEVMVWVHKGDVSTWGTAVGTYEANGITATIYHRDTYTAVVFDQDLPSAKLDLTAIFHTLTNLGIMSDNEYLASVELGAEVVSGVGSLTINNLDLDVRTRGDNGTIVIKEVTGAGTTVYHALVDAPFAPGVTDVLNDGGVKIGTLDTVLDGHGGATQSTYGLNGKLLGVDVLSVNASGNIATLHYAADGTLLGSDLKIAGSDGGLTIENYSATQVLTGFTTIGLRSTDAAPTVQQAALAASPAAQRTTAEPVETRFYDADRHLIGGEIRLTDAKGNVVVEFRDAAWTVTAKEVFQHRASGATATIFYDEDGDRSGIDITAARQDGTTLVRHLDAAQHVIGVDRVGTMADDKLGAIAGGADFFGGMGSDTMRGWKDADTFHFDTVIGQGDVDRILAFDTARDTIDLHADIFSAMPGLGTLDASAFVLGTAAQDADDRVIYNPGTGALLYDADGSGAGEAILFAYVRADAPLTAADFTIV